MKEVLDVCCGSRMFYFDKKTPLVHFNDCRQVNEEIDELVWEAVLDKVNVSWREEK